MPCESCAHYTKIPNGTVCRHCGRFLDNKFHEIAAVFVTAALLGVFSHYILTGKALLASRVLWLQSALQAPYTIYESPAYLAATVSTLAALVAIPVLTGFAYGSRAGIVVGFFEGFLCGVYGGVVVFPVLAGVSGIRRTRSVPSTAWPLVSVFAGALFYAILVWKYGPVDSPLYKEALVRFVVRVNVLAVSLVGAMVLFAYISKYSSLQVVLASLALAAFPAIAFFGWVSPERLEAHLVEYRYGASRHLDVRLPAGMISPETAGNRERFPESEQLGNLFDTLKYVDAIKAKTLAACDAYTEKYPYGEKTGEIMLLAAAMHDIRVNMTLLKRYDRLEAYYDRIAERALPIYNEIAERFPGTPQAALALYSVAEGTLQAGKPGDARGLFEKAKEALLAHVSPSFSPAVFGPPRSVADLYSAGHFRRHELNLRLHEALLLAERRLALIKNNSDFGGQPLGRLAALDPRGEDFATAATALLITYKDSKLTDNIKLALAERLPDPYERAGAMEALLDIHPESDVRDRMLLDYAKARLAADLSGEGAEQAELALRRLLADYPSSTYRYEAKDQLAKITASRKAGANR